MTDFIEFYQSGGPFMHVIAFATLCALVCMGLALQQRRNQALHQLWRARSTALLKLCVCAGALGSVRSLIDVAKISSSASLSSEVIAGGLGMALFPFAFALMGAFVLRSAEVVLPSVPVAHSRAQAATA